MNIWKPAGWMLTTLLIPVIVFMYQRFSDDIRQRQALEAEFNTIEFELAGRLGQFSSTFFSLLERTNGTRLLKKGVGADWLQETVIALRQGPTIDMATPVSGAKLLVTPISPATKDMTIFGLFSRATYLQQQMITFLELGFYQRVLIGRLAPQDFCKSRREQYLWNIALRMTSPRPNSVKIEDWRPQNPGTNDSETACLKAWKYQEAIAALLVPDRFTEIGQESNTAVEASLLKSFDNEFRQKLLYAVPDFDLPYIDTFAG